MKILSKVVLLVLLFLLPILFYLFLQFFGENQYTLPIYYQDNINKELPNSDFQDSQYTIPDFSLKDLQGNVKDQSLLEGHITLVCFANGSNTLAMIFDDLLKISQAFKDEKKLQLFIIASEEDSLGEMFMSFSKYYLTDNHPWLFLQGSSQAIADLASCSCMLEVGIHSPFLVLVDSLKRMRGYYTTWGERAMKQLKTELYILISASFSPAPLNAIFQRRTYLFLHSHFKCATRGAIRRALIERDRAASMPYCQLDGAKRVTAWCEASSKAQPK
ncbi:MAG: hypothetical protein MI674_04955 [Cytophagales bacterium]|nr:hypothetical protein [Cytophagales bacterium]